MSRMRLGEWVAALGSVGLFVMLFFDWFGLDASLTKDLGISIEGASGWSSLGWLMIVLTCVLIFGGAALSYMTIKRASPAWPVGAAVLTWIVGSLIFLVLLVRVTIAQPGNGDEYISVQVAGYLGLVFAFLIPAGAFLSIRDERMDTAEAKAYMPPPARTAPGT